VENVTLAKALDVVNGELKAAHRRFEEKQAASVMAQNELFAAKADVERLTRAAYELRQVLAGHGAARLAMNLPPPIELNDALANPHRTTDRVVAVLRSGDGDWHLRDLEEEFERRGWTDMYEHPYEAIRTAAARLVNRGRIRKTGPNTWRAGGDGETTS